jgi:ABC-type multidrug transport system permease subunit
LLYVSSYYLQYADLKKNIYTVRSKTYFLIYLPATIVCIIVFFMLIALPATICAATQTSYWNCMGHAMATCC